MLFKALCLCVVACCCVRECDVACGTVVCVMFVINCGCVLCVVVMLRAGVGAVEYRYCSVLFVKNCWCSLRKDSVMPKQASVDYLPHCAYIYSPDNCPVKVSMISLQIFWRNKLQRPKF